jgi:hypothetical protein
LRLFGGLTRFSPEKDLNSVKPSFGIPSIL